MIQTTDHGPVRELRLARPPANALSPELIAALDAAVAAALVDGARAIVLSGAPGRFSGGLDIPHLLQLDREAIRATWHAFYAMLRRLATSPVPIAAAITGHSPAGGAVISLYCDARFMADGDFRIGLNEVPVGIPLPPVIYEALVRVVGERRAEWLAVAGTLLLPAEALAVGLVDEVVAAERVVERAVEWCQGLLALPPTAMARTRARARARLADLFDARHEEIEGLVDVWFSDETQTTLSGIVARLAAKRG